MPGPVRLFQKSDFTSVKYAVGKVDIYGNLFHENFELYLPLRGDIEFISGRTRQNLVPGQLIIIPPGEYHQFVVRDDITQYERCVVDIWPGFLPDGILKDALSAVGILSLPEDHRILSDFVYLINNLKHMPREDLFYIIPAVVTDIVFLIRNASEEKTLSPGKLRSASLKLITFIDAHYRENLSLEELAEKCFISVSSLCHIFQEDFGISVKKYINQKRMTEAHRAILSGGSSKEVSLLFGYKDYSAFYRAYQNYYGYSPSETHNHSE